MSVLLKCTPAQLADGVAIDHAEQEGATKEYDRARRHQRAERDDPFEHAADEGVARQRDRLLERRPPRRRGEASRQRAVSGKRVYLRVVPGGSLVFKTTNLTI